MIITGTKCSTECSSDPLITAIPAQTKNIDLSASLTSTYVFAEGNLVSHLPLSLTADLNVIGLA